MDYFPVYDRSILGAGPLFADEIGWAPPVTQRLVDTYDLSRRNIRFRGGSGIYTIYFPMDTLEAALIRYADRYRGLIEVVLRRGLAGERMLLQQGWYEDEIDYLLNIIPEPVQRFNPAVYELLWRSLAFEEYLAIVEVLNRGDKRRIQFTPADLAQAAGLEDAGSGYFTAFLRRNLIKSVESYRIEESMQTRRSRGDSVQLDPQERYRLTEMGERVVQGVLSEHSRLFEARSYAPLRADVERARAHIPPRGEVKGPVEEDEQATADLDVPGADEFTELANELEASLRTD